MVSIKDLAQLTGYSTATISRVINNSPKVSESTRQQVASAIKAVGYHPNFVGRNLRLSSSRKLLVLLPTAENTFYGDILRGAESSASDAGYQIIIGVTQNSLSIENGYIEMLRSKQVDGLVLANTSMDKFDLNRLSENWPVVLLAHSIEGANTSSVSVNNVKAAYEATKHLISLGHRDIAIISGSYYRNPSLERETGFFNALEEANLSFDKDYLVRSDYDFGSGMAACRRLMSLNNPPTAIFCTADSIAIGAEKHLVNSGLEKKVSVVGFDNVIESEFFFNGITTVNQPKYELGRISINLLLEKIDDINSPVKSIFLDHDLIERGSTNRYSEA